MNILRFPLVVLAISFVALWLSVRIGVSFRKRRRSLEENEREDFGIIMAASLGRSMPLLFNWRPTCGPLSKLQLRRSRHPWWLLLSRA